MKNQEPLFEYLLRLADNSLIAGHRLSEWCGHGPILEEDIAMTNIALDLVGQSRLLYGYAAEVESKGHTEDDLAYHRDTQDFKNCLLVEQHNGDFAMTMMRQFLFSAFHFEQYEKLKTSKDTKLAAIAEKSLKEITYHLRHASQWVLRLGDGTQESHDKAQNAIDSLWQYTDDLFEKNETDDLLIKENVVVDIQQIKPLWEKKVKDVISEATLQLPSADVFMVKGGINGHHTERLGFLLAEMQYLQRVYPDAKW